MRDRSRLKPYGSEERLNMLMQSKSILDEAFLMTSVDPAVTSCRAALDAELTEINGLDTSPYTPEQQAKMAALVKENRERKKREKQAKLKAIADEQAAKMKEIEEQMEKKKKAAEDEVAAEEDKERMRIESREGSSGTEKDTDAEIEKKISEWVANLSLGEDEEAESYVTEDEKAALAAELAAMTDPMERREREDEQKLQWKLRMKREKRRSLGGEATISIADY
ncbi:hypothetical protein CBR_g3351 [Chara braunii]|uniref:Uncharacterized protein n=1 Tax=Chara braunii TaxID=69332 RepID=A0A388JQQ3_CHABU|nr:hypothetical protein CBR_g3351 [Chara braunii]|eukprot:GBG60107.1 hypothetical protein CBR_g3351 [Chara braunii]